jgi:hypothetical protein
MQSAVLFAGIPGPDRKVACLAYPTSGIPMEARMADYIRPTLAAEQKDLGHTAQIPQSAPTTPEKLL